MIWVLYSDIILADQAWNIWRNNAYKVSYIRKKRRANITERRRNGDWMVTEWSLTCTCHSVDWMVTERRLSVFTEWWHLVLWVIINMYITHSILRWARYNLILFNEFATNRNVTYTDLMHKAFQLEHPLVVHILCCSDIRVSVLKSISWNKIFNLICIKALIYRPTPTFWRS